MYEMNRRVTYSQVTRNLKMDMAMIAHFFQDCTIFHSESIGKGVTATSETNTAWFLSSWQIEVEEYPAFGQEVVVRTWPHDFKGMYGYRNFDISDKNGKRLVRANSIWLFMDLKKGRPEKPTEEDLKGYDLELSHDLEYLPRKIQIFEEECRLTGFCDETPIKVKPSFLDSNMHVNNGRYVSEAMDYLNADKNIHHMRVDYRKAAALGDEMYPVVYIKDDYQQVVFSDKEGNPFVIVEVY